MQAAGYSAWKPYPEAQIKLHSLKNQKQTYQHLMSTFRTLPCDNFEVISGTAAKFLETAYSIYDIVFIDPPFNSGEIEKILPQLSDFGLVHMGSMIYVENNRPLNLPKSLSIHRQGRAGRIYYYLLKPII